MGIYIVLLGPPGSGKGTQAKHIAQTYGLPQISTGDLFRAMKSLDTPPARQIQEIMARGELVPDDVTIEMVRERLAEADCKSGATLDGFPRTAAQAEALERMLADSFGSGVAMTLLLEVPQAVTVQRLMGRAGHENRADDTPAVMENRYRVYLDNTEPLIGYYEQRGLLERVDGEQGVEAVTTQIMGKVARCIENAGKAT